jgi:hypothetical protein
MMTTYEELREMAIKAEKAAAYWKARAEKAEALLKFYANEENWQFRKQDQ